MEKGTLVVTLRVNAMRVYSQEIPAIPIGTIRYLEVPPKIVKGDYHVLQITLERKGAQ